jgi:tRNA threonylcarbamoyladenosine biosynthesis protein TsaE
VAVLISRSPADTEGIGEALGAMLTSGIFISLHGELGAGKTQFARGVARGLGVAPHVPVTSPTFTLLNIYEGRLLLYHFDLYRLAGDEDARDLGFDEYFGAAGVVLVEWAERLAEELPAERLDISLSHAGDDCRQLELTPHGRLPALLVERLAATFPS